MAASLKTDIEDLIQCSICLEFMTDARVLICQHSYCYKCLEPLAHNQNLKCPKCRKSTWLLTGLNHLQKDFTLNKLAASYRKKRLPSIICAACPNLSKPNWLCIECQDYLCQTCTDAHNKIQLFEHHNIVCMANTEEKCPEHKRKDLSYVCTDCQKFVCGVCIITAHQEHHVENAETHLRSMRHGLQTQLAQVNELTLNAIVDEITEINIPELEADVAERFTTIQKKITGAAIQQCTLINIEEVRLQQSLASCKNEFDTWLGNIKQAKLLGSKLAEFRSRIVAYRDAEASIPKQETLNGINDLNADITSAIGQIACTEKELSSFCSVEIPEDFITTSTSKPSIGTINKTTEIQPGFRFSTFARQLLPQPGLICKRCLVKIVGSWYKCRTCTNYSVCPTCKSYAHTHEKHNAGGCIVTWQI